MIFTGMHIVCGTEFIIYQRNTLWSSLFVNSVIIFVMKQFFFFFFHTLVVAKEALFFFFLEQESKTLRIHDIHTLVHKLPEANFEMLDLLIGHLRK